MNIGEKLRSIRTDLLSSCDDASFEARQLIASVTDIPANNLSLHLKKELSPYEIDRLDSLVIRRKKHEPLQYIVGAWSFFGLEFILHPGILIPRQDTECLVEEAISYIKENHVSSVLDLCCGSGCIGTSIAVHTGIMPVYSDISPYCIHNAEMNAVRNGVHGTFYCGDLFEPVEGLSFDLICINPPYLTESDMCQLQREVRFEPSLALFGGNDGCDFYRRIALSYKHHLNPNGMLLMEIGCDQAYVSELFQNSNVLKDLNNKPRVIRVYG